MQRSLAPILALLSGGCALTIADGDDIACDAMAVASAQVTVQDANGELVTDAEVRFEDGEACESWEAGQFVCGWERAGVLSLVADGQGYLEQSFSVDVPQGECHVETQQVIVTLEEVACPPVQLYGVEVLTVSAAGDAIPAKVEWLPLDGMDFTNPMPCEDWGDSYACAENTGGEIEIWATNREFGSFYTVVDVPMDDCGPIPQRITAVIDRDPD